MFSPTNKTTELHLASLTLHGMAASSRTGPTPQSRFNVDMAQRKPDLVGTSPPHRASHSNQLSNYAIRFDLQRSFTPKVPFSRCRKCRSTVIWKFPRPTCRLLDVQLAAVVSTKQGSFHEIYHPRLPGPLLSSTYLLYPEARTTYTLLTYG